LAQKYFSKNKRRKKNMTPQQYIKPVFNIIFTQGNTAPNGNILETGLFSVYGIYRGKTLRQICLDFGKIIFLHSNKMLDFLFFSPRLFFRTIFLKCFVQVCAVFLRVLSVLQKG
jgi:hypothetical protein